MNSATTSC
uniref:Z.mays IBP2 initiator-binding protein n=1 Tax=Zea mays TaxID=4577 RepID=V9H0W0_MAIZE|nr:unnamed protein product [Zea mays]